MSLWLNDDELITLTGKRQRAAQIKVLASLKPTVTFRVRPDDSFPLVDRAQFEQDGQVKRRRPPEPNYAAGRGH